MFIDRETFARLCWTRDALCDVDSPRTLASLAAELGVSRFHLIRQYRAVFGTTPRQAQIAARLDRARELLGLGHSVTQACMAVGFSSLGSFSTLFARRVGTTPSEYRKQAHAEPIPGCLELMSGLPQFPRSTG